MEADLVQFSLRRTKANEQCPEPRIELTFKIGQVTLHTRPDSFQSLVDALNYYIDGLDLRPLIKEAPETAGPDSLRGDPSRDLDEEEDGVFEQAEENAPHDLLASVDETMFGNHLPGFFLVFFLLIFNNSLTSLFSLLILLTVKEKLQKLAQQARNHEEFTDITHDHETMDFVEGFYPDETATSLIEPVGRPKSPGANLLASFTPLSAAAPLRPRSPRHARASLEDINVDVYVDDDMIDGGGTWDGMTEYGKSSQEKGKGREIPKPRQAHREFDFMGPSSSSFDRDPLSHIPAPDVWISDDPEDVEPVREEIPWDAPPDLEGSSSLGQFASSPGTLFSRNLISPFFFFFFSFSFQRGLRPTTHRMRSSESWMKAT